MKIKTIGGFPGKDWWYKIGKVYSVRKYPYKSTRGGTLNLCSCSKCVAQREGQELFEMFQDIQTGSLIPVKFCKLI